MHEVAKVLEFLVFNTGHLMKEEDFDRGIQDFVGKIMSLLFNRLCMLVITFLPRSKHLLISWLQSPSAEILGPQK